MGSLPRCEFSLQTSIKKFVSPWGYFLFWSVLEGVPWFFSLQMASPRAYFWRMQREVFARWSGDLLHRDDYERLKWPRKKILLPEKNLRIVPEKVYCQPEKKIKKSGREISKMGEKTAKKAGKSGRESRFLPEKKVKISPKYCFSGTLPFLGQKKKHWPKEETHFWYEKCIFDLNFLLFGFQKAKMEPKND